MITQIAAYKLIDERAIDDQDFDSVVDEPMDCTQGNDLQLTGTCECPTLEGESIRMDMTGPSVQSDEDKTGLESGDEMEQQVSKDEAKDTPLMRRTRSARASEPSKYVLPSAIIPDEE